MKTVRIGIVDDHMVVINGLTTMLSNFDHLEIVYTATESTDVLRQLEKIDLDLLFMDIQMPIVNGYEATHLIRECSPHIHIPIIALTAGNVKGAKE